MALNKAQRAVAKLFAHVPKFVAKKGRYSPLPWALRRAQPLFTPRAWQVYTYLVMRSGPEAVTWFSDKQIAYDIGITHRKIAPQLALLTKLGLIELGEHNGLRYICLVDPVHALMQYKHKADLTKVEKDALHAVEEDLEEIGVDTLPEASPTTSAETVATPSASANT